MQRFTIEIRPAIPARLERLAELSCDLRYSWDRNTRTLFSRLDRSLWDACGHNPKVFLRRVDERKLAHAADDPVYLDAYDRTLSRYDTYQSQSRRTVTELAEGTLIAYFSAEFGFHESIQIYSGGLGILAGDHCKAASDLALDFVGVGLLYRQGYFEQTIDAEGNQVATYKQTDFRDLPFSPALSPGGGELRVRLELDGRDVALRIWEAKAGRIKLYFLDSDLPENESDDRAITYQLYGGDQTNRIKQEIVLGVGGVRALRAVGVSPTVWHVNEGHAAFSIIERCREMTQAGVEFPAALEACAGATVFTTHTAVRAGHDVFSSDMIERFFAKSYEQMGLTLDSFMALGDKPDNGDGFNLTALAVRGSRLHNAVSRIHQGVSSRLLASMWPQIPPEENPVSYVTNGVHVATFLAREWADVFDAVFGGEWRSHLTAADFWSRVDSIPEHLFWSVRQTLKSRMLETVRTRLTHQWERNGCSGGEIARMARYLDPRDPNILTVGFARRFATYKRATLLFHDLDRLRAIVADESRPIVFVFAGKAHPADRPAQDLMRSIHAFSKMPEFQGRVLLIEGYDLALARRLTSGVDVWLNTPEYPLEASGTSGQKAGMNGVLNLSVLDGWWGEGFDGTNGWAIKPFAAVPDQERRNAEEAGSLYDILGDEVIPLYYHRDVHEYSNDWVLRSKRSMQTLLPRFSAGRMMEHYLSRLYEPASRQAVRLAAGGFAAASDLATWKQRVRDAWSGVRVRRTDEARESESFGSGVLLEVAVALNGLEASDVRIECLASLPNAPLAIGDREVLRFTPHGTPENGEQRYRLDLRPKYCGLLTYEIRAYPYHEALTHPFETGLMLYL
ncbi:MAG TPA: alpha-glucan family phosphorylase [Candidatus Eremiobacteraceae bacterium]|jgi:starch phosphorylase